MKSQLQRILKSDLSEYKIAVSDHISNLDHLDQCLTERSAFMQNFNQLLKQELQRFHKEPPTEFDAIQLTKAIEKDKSSPYFEQQKKNNGQLFLPKQKLPQKALTYKQLNNRLLRQLAFVEKFVKRTRQEVYLIIEDTKKLLMREFTKNIWDILGSVNKIYQNKVVSLQKLVDQLVQENRSLQQKNQAVRQTLAPKIEIKANNYESKHYDQIDRYRVDYSPIQSIQRVNTLNVFMDEKLSDLPSQRQSVESQYLGHHNSNVYQSERNLMEMTLKNNNEVSWRHYVCDLEHVSVRQVKEKQGSRLGKENNRYFAQQSKSKQLQNEACQPKFPALLRKQTIKNYEVPTIRSLIVSFPPVEQGFSVLKLGSEVVYRGMWKQRKFHGKGILTMPDYTYEGDFQQGLFHGRGALKVGTLQYMGEFVQNRAEGEGQLRHGSRAVSGHWRKNILIQQY